MRCIPDPYVMAQRTDELDAELAGLEAFVAIIKASGDANRAQDWAAFPVLPEDSVPHIVP